jgi:hypothetical protein
MQIDLIQSRINDGICPICCREIDTKKEETYKLVSDPKYGVVTICSNHTAGGQDVLGKDS